MLARLVDRELRQIAGRLLACESEQNHWQRTELVQEAYLRLLDWRGAHWQNRRHFYATAAHMMRRVLVDAARARRALKRGEGKAPLALHQVDAIGATPAVDLIALEEALGQLASRSPRASQVIELRFYGGFSVEDTAEALDVSVRTVINDWNTARAWLHHRLTDRAASSPRPHRSDGR